MRILKIFLAAATTLAVSVGAPAAPGACDRTPNPARWSDVGTPDAGLEHMRITVHRGAANLAPEDTIPAFEYAIAYGLDMIEVDVQQTLDGRWVVLHDYEVDDKTNGSGLIPLMTYDEVTALNAADNDGWRGTEYDPTYVPGLEEVLALASKHDVGISFDLKETVANAAGVALLASQYPGIIERSIFQPYVPGRTEQILAVAPDATVMFNSQYEDTPPAALFALGTEYQWFGSSLPNFPPEAIAAIHDACGFVQPNVYQGDVTGSEAGDLAFARDIGADGAMVNNPDVAVAVLDRPVATSITLDGARACLVGNRGLGLPGKTLEVDGSPIQTARGGCVALPQDWESVVFAGDDSALPSAL
ncbi:MAG: glycerophosphodiester phosphodiesterase family protein [Actinomycetota bacterium]